MGLDMVDAFIWFNNLENKVKELEERIKELEELIENNNIKIIDEKKENKDKEFEKERLYNKR